jgi:hypothetical protein
MALNRLSYPKALAKIVVMPRGRCTLRWVFARCHLCYAHDCHGGPAIHKLDGFRALRSRGWIYDVAGNWICPACKEGV